MTLGIPGNIIRKLVGNEVAEQGFRCAKQKKYRFPPPLQSDADVNENQYEPFGHSAVKAARRKKTYREKQKEQHRDSGSSRIDAIVLYTFFNNDGYREKACRQYQHIDKTSSHGKYDCQRNHADACNDAEHTFLQADFVV